LLLIICVPALGTPIEEKELEKQELIYQIQSQQNELDILSNQYTAALLREEELESEIVASEEEIKNLENDIVLKKDKLQKQCAKTYKDGSVPLLEVLLSSTSYDAFVTNLDFCKRAIGQTNKTLDEVRILKQKIQEKKAIQEQEKIELDMQVQKIEESKQNADNIIINLQQQYEQLDNELALLILQQQQESVFQASINQEVYNYFSTENIAPQDESYPVSNYYIPAQSFSQEQIQEVIAEIQSQNAAAGITSDYNDIVSRAYSMLGAAYSWGGTTSAGFDCSGFVSYCLTGEEGTRLGTTETFAG
jgi:peptidoglycan hydrolase CwlO-like protein